MKKLYLILSLVLFMNPLSAQPEASLDAPASVSQYEIAEFVIRIKNPSLRNPFTEVDLKGTFTYGSTSIVVDGFADAPDGSVFRLRFSPEMENVTYAYDIVLTGRDLKKQFTGKLVSSTRQGKGPVIADPVHPKHFIYAGSGEPFFHLGITLYNLVDIANDDALIESTIKYCLEHGFNKVRFLLTGYPRDFDNRTSDDVDHGVPEDPWKSLNYGALPGRVNPLPAWAGKPHNYDFERFNVSHWQRIDKTVRLMKENGIIATCIFIIEKQNLPKELGRLTANEYRLYQYAVARLSAFNNVWWDLGNEHNEFRDKSWGNTMGGFVKEKDPYNRMASAHAYADFFYNDSPWADYIITQQYGDLDSVHNWTLKYYNVPKPYINEEYGYEGITDKPVGHGMNSDWVRRCHWAIAMAGGYATYGDWSKGTSYFYMGFPGQGIAASQLKFIKTFFQSLPFNEMVPSDKLINNGYCIASPPCCYAFYLPSGGNAEIDLTGAAKRKMNAMWYDPVTGKWLDGFVIKKGIKTVSAPDGNDWVLLIRNRKQVKK